MRWHAQAYYARGAHEEKEVAFRPGRICVKHTEHTMCSIRREHLVALACTGLLRKGCTRRKRGDGVLPRTDLRKTYKTHHVLY